MRFKRIRVSISSLLFISVVALRIELSAARLSAALFQFNTGGNQPSTTVVESGTSGSNRPFFWFTGLLVPNQACSQLHLYPMLSCSFSQNGRI